MMRPSDDLLLVVADTLLVILEQDVKRPSRADLLRQAILAFYEAQEEMETT